MQNDDRQPESSRHFERLKALATGARSGTLERLREACDALAARNEPMTYKAVEREIKAKHGPNAGPRAQSICNRSGADLKLYVDLREKERAATEPRSARAPLKLDDLLKSESSNHLLVSQVKALQHELETTKKELRRALLLLKSRYPADALDDDSNPPLLPELAAPKGPPPCVEELVAVLSNKERLISVGLIRDPNGRIRRATGSGQEFLAPRLVTELEKLVGKSGSDDAR